MEQTRHGRGYTRTVGSVSGGLWAPCLVELTVSALVRQMMRWEHRSRCETTSDYSHDEGKRPPASRGPLDAMHLGSGWKAVEDVFEVLFLIGSQNRAGLHQKRRRREGGGGRPVSCSGQKEPSRHGGAVGWPGRSVLGVRTGKDSLPVGAWGSALKISLPQSNRWAAKSLQDDDRLMVFLFPEVRLFPSLLAMDPAHSDVCKFSESSGVCLTCNKS